MVGTTIAHYQILEKLGEGGMGVVYKARDGRLQRIIAIKVLPANRSDPVRRLRFLREAQMASSLNHPGIVTIHDVSSDGEVDFIVMEYLDGKPLNKGIPEGGMGVVKALQYGEQIADALERAHNAGIIHRDLKPGNIYITAEGRVKVLDFGLAKLTQIGGETDEQTMQSPLTQDGAFLGTILYAAPEQSETGEVDHRADIYSFGVVLFEMLTSRRPYRSTSLIGVLREIASGERIPLRECLPGLPESLENLLLRMLHPNPARRPQRMVHVQNALAEIRREIIAGASTTGEETLAVPSVGERRPPSSGSSMVAVTSPPTLGTELVSIGVLPFTSMSQDPENTYIADGLAHEITNALASIPGLRVAPHLATFRYKSESPNLKSISEALNTRFLLTGSLRRSGQRIRVIAELTDAVLETVVWSRKYDRDMADLFDLQDEITRAIVSSTGGQLRRFSMEAASRVGAENLDAWGLTRKAFHFWNHEFRLEGVNDAVELLRQAVRLDPQYASAYAYLGLYQIQRVVGFISEQPEADLSEALASVEKAVELSPKESEVLENAGLVWFLTGSYDRAVPVLRRSTEISPFNMVAWGYLALAHAWAGGEREVADADKILQHLIGDAPDHPSYPYWHYFLYAVRMRQGRYAEAVESALQTMAIHPLYILARLAHANALGFLDRTEEARDAVKATVNINPYFRMEQYRMAVHLVCRKPELANFFLGGLQKAGLLGGS